MLEPPSDSLATLGPALTMPPNAPPAFHLLAKPTGAICNLDCQYCFFLAKEMLYPGSRFRMADDLLETYIRQYIEAPAGPEVNIAWQGGEPTLMGVEFFRRAVELVGEVSQAGHAYSAYACRPTARCWTTSGRFFRENKFLIGLSIDGPPELHDAYRVDKGGAPTFEGVMAARLLQAHGVEFNILTTVHAANGDHPLEVYRFLRDEIGTQFMQFIPIVERDNADGALSSKGTR